MAKTGPSEIWVEEEEEEDSATKAVSTVDGKKEEECDEVLINSIGVGLRHRRHQT